MIETQGFGHSIEKNAVHVEAKRKRCSDRTEHTLSEDKIGGDPNSGGSLALGREKRCIRGRGWEENFQLKSEECLA